ncbi:MAG: type II secretion system F family protein, partial [Kiritimatiellae bacterium]|nr:type II secretion system F family protein [Kiritimatiellia bacterium]
MGYARKRTAPGGSQPPPSASAPAPAPRQQSAAKPKGGSSGKSIWSMQIGKPKQKTAMKRVEVLLFVSELADLLQAGMTLGQALQALANQGEDGSGQRYVCQDLCDRIVRGESFSDACAHHPKTFPPLFSNMLRAGEASGAMIEVLRRLGEHYERDDNMRGKIKGALTYPVIVLCIGVVAVIGALVWIIPQFQKVFDSMGASLPLPTRILIGLSDAVINYGWAMALGVVAVVWWLRRWSRTQSGRRRIDGWKLSVPLVRGIVASGAYSSLAYTLKTLLSNGVNVLQALKICEETCGNAVIGDALATARRRVTDGTTISGPLAASGVFPRMMTDMLAVGEQAGDMAASLENVGRRYQKDMDRNIASFTNALEPILIVLIASVVGFVAIAILTAVFKVS